MVVETVGVATNKRELITKNKGGTLVMDSIDHRRRLL